MWLVYRKRFRATSRDGSGGSRYLWVCYRAEWYVNDYVAFHYSHRSCANNDAGGQLRPHAYSRYSVWSQRFGSKVAMDLITHEMAHLDAFRDLTKDEKITEEVCLKFVETFDAAMTEEAWIRLKGALDDMRRDHGADNEIVQQCRTIEDASEAEEATQMKGAMAAILHPSGQM